MADLFAVVRSTLTDLVGTTKTAILFRRAALATRDEEAALHEFAVDRQGIGYVYRLPASWHIVGEAQARAAFTGLVLSLLPLLAEMDGAGSARRLSELQDLHDHEIIGHTEVARWAIESPSG